MTCPRALYRSKICPRAFIHELAGVACTLVDLISDSLLSDIFFSSLNAMQNGKQLIFKEIKKIKL